MVQYVEGNGLGERWTGQQALIAADTSANLLYNLRLRCVQNNWYQRSGTFLVQELFALAIVRPKAACTALRLYGGQGG